MLNRLMPVLTLLAFTGAAQAAPASKTPPVIVRPAPAPYASALPGVPDFWRPDSLTPLLLTSRQPQALIERLPIPQAAPPFPHGPGDIIPPCVIAYGYTTQGPTDQYGHLLHTPAHLPRWTDVSAPASRGGRNQSGR